MPRRAPSRDWQKKKKKKKHQLDTLRARPLPPGCRAARCDTAIAGEEQELVHMNKKPRPHGPATAVRGDAAELLGKVSQ